MFTILHKNVTIIVLKCSSLKNTSILLLLLNRFAYAALYNVSIQFNGHLLMENNSLIKTLQNDIKVIFYKDINETLIFALNLLHSLTKNISDSMYIILKNEVSNKFKLKKYY